MAEPQRSPQGEGHEAGIEAAARALKAPREFISRKAAAEDAVAAYLSRVSPSRDGTERVVRWALEDLRAGDVESASLRLTGLVGGIAPSPIAPSRDGTVAVEDVRAQTVAEIVAMLRENARLSVTGEARYFNARLADKIEREFSRSSSGRPEQPSPDVLGGVPPSQPKEDEERRP